MVQKISVLYSVSLGRKLEICIFIKWFKTHILVLFFDWLGTVGEGVYPSLKLWSYFWNDIIKCPQGQDVVERMLKYLISIQNAQSTLFGNYID